jgi:2-C-methyl-D-erythritol 4-phosphate cytidylyltransferase
MKTALSKQFLTLGGRPVLWHALSVFEASPLIDEIVVVLSAQDREFAEARLFSAHPFRKIRALVEGGPRRSDSVLNGLRSLGSGVELVVIHDGCRPFASEQMIRDTLSAAKETGGAITALPLGDTLKRERADRLIAETVDRKGMWQAQTPQAFRLPLLLQAFQYAAAEKIEATDESMLFEALGLPVRLVTGSPFNIKLTLPEDLALAESIYHLLKGSQEAGVSQAGDENRNRF